MIPFSFFVVDARASANGDFARQAETHALNICMRGSDSQPDRLEPQGLITHRKALCFETLQSVVPGFSRFAYAAISEIAHYLCGVPATPDVPSDAATAIQNQPLYILPSD